MVAEHPLPEPLDALGVLLAERSTASAIDPESWNGSIGAPRQPALLPQLTLELAAIEASTARASAAVSMRSTWTTSRSIAHWIAVVSVCSAFAGSSR